MLGKTVKSLPAHIMASVTDTLRWVYMLETWRPKSLKTVPQAAKIARLYCVFLTGEFLGWSYIPFLSEKKVVMTSI